MLKLNLIHPFFIFSTLNFNNLPLDATSYDTTHFKETMDPQFLPKYAGYPPKNYKLLIENFDSSLYRIPAAHLIVVGSAYCTWCKRNSANSAYLGKLKQSLIDTLLPTFTNFLICYTISGYSRHSI